MVWKLIVNPVAGSGFAAKTAQDVQEELTRRGQACELLMTKAPGDATQLARQAAQDPDCIAVLSVGGDGTAFDVASGIIGTGKPMGIIPAGTGNDFIKTIGLPAEPLKALDFILSHQPRPLDVGRINDRYYLNVCGTGFDVTVLEQMQKASSKSRGMLPYLIGVIRAIGCFQPIHVKYEIDGQAAEDDVLICSVANGRFIGGGIAICPAAKVDDSKLDVVLVDSVPRWRVPFYLPGLLLGRILRFGITRHVLCDRITVESKGMTLQIDGEIYRMDRAEFAAMPGALQLYW